MLVREVKTIRVKRKEEHLKLARLAPQSNQHSLLGDVHLLPSSLTEYSLNEIDLSVSINGKLLKAPIIINAMTGGCQEAEVINYRLAKLAAALGLGMAIGSQHAALENPHLQSTYQAAREANPEGLIWGNLSHRATAEQAQQAVKMVDADGLQIHLNQAQELAMPEGERVFAGLKENLQAVCSSLSVPVVGKQTGNGLMR